MLPNLCPAISLNLGSSIPDARLVTSSPLAEKFKQRSKYAIMTNAETEKGKEEVRKGNEREIYIQR